MKIITTKRYSILEAQYGVRSGSFDDRILIYNSNKGTDIIYDVLVIYDFIPPFQKGEEPRINIVRVVNKRNGRDILKHIGERTLTMLREKVNSLERRRV